MHMLFLMTTDTEFIVLVEYLISYAGINVRYNMTRNIEWLQFPEQGKNK